MSDVDRLVLRPLQVSDEQQALRGDAELAAEHMVFLPGRDRRRPFEEYLVSLERQQRGEGLLPGIVPWTFRVGEVDGELVGRVSIRHQLNPALRQEGGHVGYVVRPSFRARGYATRMLALSVQHLRDELGITDVLVTCDDTNTASATVIERCGGQLQDKVVPRPGAVPVRRYWIR